MKDSKARRIAQRAAAISAAIAAKYPPEVLSAPIIPSVLEVGVPITPVHGDYTSNPISYTYRWLYNTTVVATTFSYTPVAGDLTHLLKFEETPTGTAGAGTAQQSNSSTVVNAITPTTGSFTAGVVAGSEIFTFSNLGAGETIVSVSPNDSRIAINLAGTKALVGVATSSEGTVNYTFTSSFGRTVTVAINTTVYVPSTLALSGSLMKGIAASGVTITGVASSSAITLNDPGLAISGSGSTRNITGTPTIEYLPLTATQDGNVTLLDIISGGALETTFGTTSAYAASPVGPLAVPAGFRMSPIVTVTRNSDGTYSHDFNMNSYRQTATVSYYCGAGGDDNNDGLTWATRVESLTKLGLLLNSQPVGTICNLYAQAKRYYWSRLSAAGNRMGFSGARLRRGFNLQAVNASGAITTSAQIINIQDYVHTSSDWVDMGNSVWRLTFPGTPAELPNGNAWDESFTHSYGRPLPVVTIHKDFVAGSITPASPFLNDPVGAVAWAAKKYGQGAAYKDIANNQLYIRTKDGRKPDANIGISIGADPGSVGRGFYMSGENGSTTTFWVKNYDSWGGTGPRIDGSELNANTKNIFYGEDMFQGYGRGGGLVFSTWGRIVLSRMKSLGGRGDGFGCNPPTDVTIGMEDAGTITNFTDYYELDCYSDLSGEIRQMNTSTNGLSTHYNSNVMTVNSHYDNVTDRFNHFIKTANVWLIAPKFGKHHGVTGDTSIGITSGYGPGNLGVQSTKVWVESPDFSTSNIRIPFEVTDNDTGGGGGHLYVRGIPAGMLWAATANTPAAILGNFGTWNDAFSYTYNASTQGAAPFTTYTGAGVTIVSNKARLVRDAAVDQKAALTGITGYTPSSMMALVVEGIALSGTGGSVYATQSTTGSANGSLRGSTTMTKLLASGGVTLVTMPASGNVNILLVQPLGTAGETVDIGGVKLREFTLSQIYSYDASVDGVTAWVQDQGGVPTVVGGKATLTQPATPGNMRAHIDVSGLTVGQLYSLEIVGAAGLGSNVYVTTTANTGTSGAVVTESTLDGSVLARRHITFIATATTHRIMWQQGSGTTGDQTQMTGFKLHTVTVAA